MFASWGSLSTDRQPKNRRTKSIRHWSQGQSLFNQLLIWLIAATRNNDCSSLPFTGTLTSFCWVAVSLGWCSSGIQWIMMWCLCMLLYQLQVLGCCHQPYISTCHSCIGRSGTSAALSKSGCGGACRIRHSCTGFVRCVHPGLKSVKAKDPVFNGSLINTEFLIKLSVYT